MNPPESNCSNSCERQFQFSSRHSSGAQFSLADGSTRFISETLDTEVLRRLMTRGMEDAVLDF